MARRSKLTKRYFENLVRHDRIGEEVDRYFDYIADKADELLDEHDALVAQHDALVAQMLNKRASWTNKYVLGDANHPYVFVVLDSYREAQKAIALMREDGMCPYFASEYDWQNPDTLNNIVFYHPITIFDIWMAQ